MGKLTSEITMKEVLDQVDWGGYAYLVDIDVTRLAMKKGDEVTFKNELKIMQKSWKKIYKMLDKLNTEYDKKENNK